MVSYEEAPADHAQVVLAMGEPQERSNNEELNDLVESWRIRERGGIRYIYGPPGIDLEAALSPATAGPPVGAAMG